MTGWNATRCARGIRRALADGVVNKIARDTGFSRKLRKFTPVKAAWTMIAGLGSGSVKTIADLLRTFTDLTGETMGYKPFHDRLSCPGCPEFFRSLLEHFMQTLVGPIQRPRRRFLSAFEDIVIHDGTAFAMNDRLARDFPGVYTHNAPAAAEVHCTYSLYQAQCTTVYVAPYSQEEREFLPEPEELRRKLILMDRGYLRTSYFREVDKAGGHFICRLGAGARNPLLLKCYDGMSKRLKIEGKRLRDIRLPRKTVDFKIELRSSRQKVVHVGRLIGIYVKKRKHHVFLYTNLPRKHSAERIGNLYRLRWQVELFFKECKSHTCLQKFQTANARIAEALIWAAMLAALFRRYLLHSAFQGTGDRAAPLVAASMSWTYLRDLAKSAQSTSRRFKRNLKETLSLLRKQAKRAHPRRPDTWMALEICPDGVP